MLILASSKGQEFSATTEKAEGTVPEFAAEARHLIDQLRSLTTAEIGTLMAISRPLAERVRTQIDKLSQPNPPAPSRPALLAFSGEAYRSLAAHNLTPDDLDFAQEHLRILSGLYGCLRPLDGIRPYRLEMATPLGNECGATLYAFWTERVTASLNRALARETQPMLINLSSVEYAKVIDKKRLKAPWLDILFQEEASGRRRTVAIYAKRARGLMASFCIRHRIVHPPLLQEFSESGYRFQPKLSTKWQWIFTRQAT